MNKLNIFIDQIPHIKHWFIKFIWCKEKLQTYHAFVLNRIKYPPDEK